MALKYATKIWLFSALVTPLILVTFFLFDKPESAGLDDIIGVVFLMQFYGSFLSVPNYLLLSLFTWIVFKRTDDVQSRRIVVQMIVLILWAIIFYVMFRDISNSSERGITFAYLVTLSFGVWYFNASEKSSKKEPHISEQLLDDDAILNE